MTINFKHWQKNLQEARKCEEELKGNQHKLDVDKDGKIEGEDLAKLRMKKEEVEESSTIKYSTFMNWLEEACGSKKMKEEEEVGCDGKKAKLKVHMGDEDHSKVSEECEIEEERGDEYGWEVKARKEKPQPTSRKVAGKAYGGAAQKDDDEDEAPKPAEKRGRGRPKGTASGARQIGSSGKKSYGGLAIHTLSLPNRNK